MNGKPVLYRRNIRTVLADPSPEFGEKGLCDSLVFNLGDACPFSCTYCYCKAVVWKLVKPVVDAHNAAEPSMPGKEFHEVVIRREKATAVLRSQLLKRNGTHRYPDPDDNRVVFISTLTDPAANLELLRETAEACEMILDLTGWQIRLLSKSSLLARIVEFIPEKHHQRLILGFSTGTRDERVCRAIAPGTAKAAKRLEALHWLQDRGFRTFGMICPSLPQEDYGAFSREACDAIRVEKCEHVWAEVMNVRADSIPRTFEGLLTEGLHMEMDRLLTVLGPKAKGAWEAYARKTFLAHAANIPPNKLRFLQYVTPASAQWWTPMRAKGAVLLGKEARILGIAGLKGSIA